MKLDKPARQQMRAHCGRIHADDGPDARRSVRDKVRNRSGHRTRRFCHQVARTLSLVLAGEFDDERLHGLQVVSVDPAPNASQLAVTLRTDEFCDSEQLYEILERLVAVSGRLRCEVARAISRKRAPRLQFCVISGRSKLARP